MTFSIRLLFFAHPPHSPPFSHHDYMFTSSPPTALQKGASEVMLRCVGFQDSPTFTMSSQRRAGRNTPVSAGSNFKFKRPSVAGVIDGSGHHDRAFEYGNTGFVAAKGARGADGGELGTGGWPPLLAGAWGSRQLMNAATMSPLAMMMASNPQMAAAMMGGMAGMMGGMGAMGMGLGGWVGPFRTPNLPNINKIVRTKIVHTSGTFFKKCSKLYFKYLHIYRK